MGMYYSFTSLSTVGFGDYHPRSNAERLVTSMILLLGVSIFSYILGNFVEILGTLQELNKDLDEGDELTKFFQVLKRFNGNKSVNRKFTDKVQAFFEYKWSYDKNLAIDSEEEMKILGQLPDEVQDKLLTNYLYSTFLNTFAGFFRLSRSFTSRDYFSWND